MLGQRFNTGTVILLLTWTFSAHAEIANEIREKSKGLNKMHTDFSSLHLNWNLMNQNYTFFRTIFIIYRREFS